MSNLLLDLYKKTPKRYSVLEQYVQKIQLLPCVDGQNQIGELVMSASGTSWHVSHTDQVGLAEFGLDCSTLLRYVS